MHDCGNMDNNNNNMVASFIMKTYHMVNDQTTDHLIGWGRANNTFVVIDPLEFSRLLLPTYFKHNNFSSFVRQLNTYGFKKVDPDRWEFANQWFLRGQKHLLKNVVRRKNGESHHRRVSGGDAAAEEVEREIERLKKEQSEMAGELKEMTRRLEATERRPEQTVAFLHKVVEDPEILTRVMSRRDFKKRRVVMAAEAAPEEWSSLNGLRSPSPEGFLRSCGGAGWFGGGGIEGVVCVNGAKGVATAEDGGDGVGFCDGGDGVGFCDGGVVALASDVEARPPPYPFSLFGGGI